MAIDLIFLYPRLWLYGIKIVPCCVRDIAHSVLGQHSHHGPLSHGNNAIGLSQGGVSRLGSTCASRFKT